MVMNNLGTLGARLRKAQSLMSELKAWLMLESRRKGARTMWIDGSKSNKAERMLGRRGRCGRTRIRSGKLCGEVLRSGFRGSLAVMLNLFA